MSVALSLPATLPVSVAPLTPITCDLPRITFSTLAKAMGPTTLSRLARLVEGQKRFVRKRANRRKAFAQAGLRVLVVRSPERLEDAGDLGIGGSAIEALVLGREIDRASGAERALRPGGGIPEGGMLGGGLDRESVNEVKPARDVAVLPERTHEA